MTQTIEVDPPTDATIEWFVRNVGPRTHWLPGSIGGEGWKFTLETTPAPSGAIIFGYKINKTSSSWFLTVNDDKLLTHYLLVN